MMTATYKSVMLTRKGGPEVLEMVETPLRAPNPGEARVRVLATGVGFTDVIMRIGYYPYAPKIPFAPGYEVVGVVDAVGDGVTDVVVGQPVAALTVHGGYAEYIYRAASEFVPCPETLDPAEAAALVLNYATAYQMLHRVANIQPGKRMLLNAAGGGVGTALIQLAQAAGITDIWGIASANKQAALETMNVQTIDYKTQDFVPIIKGVGGVDAAFDGIGGAYVRRMFTVLRAGGTLAAYGLTASIKEGKSNNLPVVFGFANLFLLDAIPDGKRCRFYGITQLYRRDPKQFREDLPKLFALLEQGKIKPVIAARLPLIAARRANEMVERGETVGKVILQVSEP
ncbi:MAG: zinc-binding dehydrogenase [Blastochloris sp.]|nr:zinc-binding dehydrogenase [Blastochloris sp.]